MKRLLLTLAVLCIMAVATSAQAATSVTFAWDASTGNPTHYKVYQGSVLGTYTKQVCDVTVLTCIVTGLPDNSTLYFVATALDAAGNESAYSNSVTVNTADTIPPSVPGNFRSILQQIVAWIKGIFGNKVIKLG